MTPASLPASSINGPPRKWNLQSAAEIFREGVSPLEYDIDRLLPSEDGPALFFGPPGSLKSYLALHAAVCSVTGNKFLGHFAVRKRPHAVYVNLDAGDRTFKRRVLKCGYRGESLYITSPDAYDIGELHSVFEQYPGAFIALDSFADMFNSQRGDDQAQVMRAFVRDLRALYSRHGCNGIIVDHPRRPRDGESNADYYGSVQKEATARVMWTAARLPAGSEPSQVRVTISCRKMSEGEPFEPFIAKAVFSAAACTLSHDGTLDPASNRITQGPTATEIVELVLQSAKDYEDGLSAAVIKTLTGLSRDAVLLAIKESKKIVACGKTRNRRYYMPDLPASSGEFQGKLKSAAQSGPTTCPDSTGTLGGRTSQGKLVNEPRVSDLNGAPGESPGEF